jgi:hypothetical protein
MAMAMALALAVAVAMAFAFAFAAVVLGSGYGDDERTAQSKKKMTHPSTCPFEVPWPSLVLWQWEHVRVLAAGRERRASSWLQSWGVCMAVMSAQHS